LGIEAFATPKTMTLVQSLREVLIPIGATAVRHSEDAVGSDIGEWQAAGVPGFEPLLDSRHYFDLHHTPADTLDKVDPKNLQRMVATLGVLAFTIADAPEMLERVNKVSE
jgi:hypothetical protein